MFTKYFDLYLLSFAVGLSVVEVASGSMMIEVSKGNCSCGGFPTSTPDVESSPLLSQSPGLVVYCDYEGSASCKSLCLALATAAKAKGPEVLCQRLKDADELKLSAFFRICDRAWEYADMTADDALCCQESKVKTCASADRSTTIINKE